MTEHTNPELTKPIRAACNAMGCRFEICITDPGQIAQPGWSESVAARSACEEALEIIQDWHARLNTFDRGSVVTLINTTAHERPVRVADDVMTLLLACQRVHHDSDGAFDVTLGPLMQRWGFRGVSPEQADPPVWGMEKIRLDPASGLVGFTRSGLELDLGGIAKGLALDEAAVALRAAGVRSAILHGGTSTAVAIGPKPGSPAFRVALGPGEEAPVVGLRDSALSVSAPHGRTVEREGKILGHILDPRSGKPADSARLAATIGPSAMLCDAWSTALLVLDKVPRALPSEMTCILYSQKEQWVLAGPDQDRVRFHCDSDKLER